MSAPTAIVYAGVTSVSLLLVSRAQATVEGDVEGAFRAAFHLLLHRLRSLPPGSMCMTARYRHFGRLLGGEMAAGVHRSIDGLKGA